MDNDSYKNTFDFIFNFLEELNPNFQVDFIRRSFAYDVRVEEYPKYIIIEFSRAILDDFEIALQEAKY
ncbi:hypothetical protein KA005_48570, partial [bacterium]|nr:hypothetical protein [bacterium]